MSERETVEVTTTTGVVRGLGRAEPTRSAAFLGIPFAQAPIGARRFAAPVPMEPWMGVRDALRFGATAQRGDPGATLIPEPSVPGRSTLNVNVFTPDPSRRAQPLPVLVFFHGGGYVAGSPASPWYDGRAFARDGVVTVTLGYRLGFDGFGHIPGAPSNRGVRDWLAGLEWVRDNIAAFGGDPNRVTIAGQSAGGGAVLTLLGMERAQHLFHGAYSLSGALADIAPDRAARYTRRLARRLRVPPTRAGFTTVPEERVLAAQRRSGAAALSELVTAGLPLGPILDGELLVRPTIDSLARGVGADKPLVLGAADDEFVVVTARCAGPLAVVPLRLLLRPFRLPPTARRAYLDANPDVLARGHARVLGRLIGDRVFRRTVLAVARARGNAPTWIYRTAFRSPRFDAAVHCVDVPFFFDCLDGPSLTPLVGEHPPQDLADAIHGAAVSFIRDGAPGWPVGPVMNAVFGGPDGPLVTEADGYAVVSALLPEAHR
ncbi:carboxylesterase/lipase family protein [Microbacterium gorillae]|uniref:carboxylesterase/lipase family protein n=1 Tax=Microbacterium gorillae TaxID=1231063 RepID=UPI000AD8E151|nr:carboxylesterase family protein [Microbacterium gorillae]